MLEASDDLKARVDSLRPEDTLKDGGADAVARVMGGPAGAELLKEIVVRLSHAQPEGTSEPSANQIRVLAFRISLAVDRFWSAFAGPAVSHSDSSRGFLAMLAALVQLVPGPGKGRPIERVIKELPRRTTGSAGT